ncbi:MAG: hypothetical protein U1F36_10845 [Planctomycetota bacterium]
MASELRRLIPSLALCVAPLLAQDPKPGSRLALALDAFAKPLIQAEDGLVRVAGSDFKAEIGARGLQFVPFLGSDAPHDLPIDFRLNGVSVAGTDLQVAAGEPKLHGETIECARGGCVETFRVDPHGIEQGFRFDSLPVRGALHIDIDVESAFRTETAADGIHFTHALGSVRYGRAVAIDATGDRLVLDMQADAKGIHIDVPAEFVARAMLPLVVDPLVGTLQSFSSTRTTRNVDFSYDRSLGRYVMVWERVYSATDSDVYAVPLDRDLAQVSPILIVDTTTESWEHCRVANFGFYDRFLVVASRSVSGQNPYIAGKLVQGGASWSIGAALEIDSVNTSSGNGARTNPVVAGEDRGGSPNIATVAFEYQSGSNDPNIEMCYVFQDGSRHPQGTFVASQSGDYATQPELCDQLGPISAHYYVGLAYRRTFQLGGSNVHQLRFSAFDLGNRTASYFGPIMTLQADSGFSVSAPFDDGTPRGACLVTADLLDPATQNRDIVAMLVSLTNGVVSPQVNLTTLEGLGSAHEARAQRHPRVTHDGCRFAIAYQDDWSATDSDIRAMTVAWRPNNAAAPFVVQDTAYIAATTDRETDPAIACGRDNSDAVRCAVGWNFESGAPTYSVQMQTYDAMAALGGFTARATGCGGLTIQGSGVPAIGHAITVQLTNSGGLAGFLVGVPVRVALAACPGCTLGADGTAFQITSLQLTIPCNAALVGTTVAFQGFDTVSPSCLGLVRLSDTLDLRMR